MGTFIQKRFSTHHGVIYNFSQQLVNITKKSQKIAKNR